MKTKILLAAALMLAFVSCNKQQQLEQPDPSKTPYDYSQASNWMVKESKGKDVDVFFLYPTVIWEGYSDAADLDDDEKKEAYLQYVEMGSFLSENANVYAPYFRQATMPYLLPLDNSDQMMEVVRGSMGKQDVFAALDYFFEHFNNGKPFILSSHSQGSAMMRTVLDEYMQKDETHKNYLKRMVAAYMLGFSVPKTWLSENGLKGATGADDTGVIIAYNTEGAGATMSSIPVTTDDYVINPLTWSTGTAKAETGQNKGSLVWIDRDEGKYSIDTPGIADAQIDPNRVALICTTINDYVDLPEYDQPFGDKSLHTYDGPAYYVNLKENAKARIDAYFADHK